MKASEEKRSEMCKFYLFLLLTAGAALLLVGVLHDRTLPFAEGWYTYYARCINEGLLPYRDFEYLYPPVYIYTVALITRAFGYGLIVLRRIGILFFLLITLGLYLVGSEVIGKKRCDAAAVAAVCGAFYLQSEVVQTFYDYVRLMDVFSIFSLYFLLRGTRAMRSGAPYRKSLCLCGLFCGIFINIKQNMGLIFFAFALLLLIYLGVWQKKSAKAVAIDVFGLSLPAVLFTGAVLAALAKSGSLGAYLKMTGVAAAGAKGGIFAILFGWLYNNRSAFQAALPAALLLLFLIVGAHVWLARQETEGACKEDPRAHGALIGALFFLPLLVLLLLVILSPKVSLALLPRYFLSTYTIFLVVTPIFAALGVCGIVDRVRGTRTLAPPFPFFVLSGAYFAISFGCGNSGGLAEGQASFGVLFLVLASLYLLEHALQVLDTAPVLAARGGVLLLCLTLALQSADKKLVYTYNWWGMNESSLHECTVPLDLPYTRGISVSPDTAAVYQGIVDAITEHTAAGEPILCFPQIPIFYVLTNRSDPGTFTKVQWFDVASDTAIQGDIELLRQSPPSAILIYHTSEYAYTSHEQAFRGGNASGTRQMRDFLLSFVKERGYRHHATYRAEDNTLTLWLAP